jgi:hypothetical protein
MQSTASLPAAVIPALRAAVASHGIRGAKQAIRSAWCNGNYSRQGLESFSGELQRWRNSPLGHEQLEALRISEFATSKTDCIAALETGGSKVWVKTHSGNFPVGLENGALVPLDDTRGGAARKALAKTFPVLRIS